MLLGAGVGRESVRPSRWAFVFGRGGASSRCSAERTGRALGGRTLSSSSSSSSRLAPPKPAKRSGRTRPGASSAEAGETMATGLSLKAEDISAENFAPFGQVIEPQPDGGEFGEGDAKLVLDKGVPRFYIMRLEKRGLSFGTIVHPGVVPSARGPRCRRRLGSR